MSRSIDICTCGKTRDEHAAYDVEQHTFFPHPQPNVHVEEVPLSLRVRNMLMNVGVVSSFVGDSGNRTMFVTLPNGQYWEVTVTLRKDPAASQEGV